VIAATLDQLGAAYGPGAILSATPLSATPVQMNMIGATAPNYFVPPTASAFLGALIVNVSASTGTITFQLYDETAGVVAFSRAVARGTVSPDGLLASTAYPLAEGHFYTWRATGSGTGYASVQPLYLMPSTTPSAASYFPPMGFNGALTTGGSVMTPANASTNIAAYYRNPRYSFVQSAILTVTGTGTVTSVYIGTAWVDTGSWPEGTYFLGPYATSTATIPANTQYNFGVKGTGTASVTLSVLLVM